MRQESIAGRTSAKAGVLMWVLLLALVLAASQAAGAATDAASSEDGDGGNDPTDPPAISDTIAYVSQNARGRDEIRLIAPDGSGDRLLWPSSDSDLELPFTITSLAWRPDGRELTFTSDHEMACSWYASDVYAVASDGSGLRRLTNAPACAGLADLPTGRVTVGVQNATFESALFMIYVQGARSLEQIALGPGAGGTVTFEEVADLGDGIQPAVAILGGLRWLGGAVAYVQPGQTVHAGTLTIAGAGFWGMGASGLSWHPDGSRLAYVFGECAGLYAMEAQPSLGEVGAELLGAGSDQVHPCAVDWGPTAATADQLLYVTTGVFDDGGIYLTTEGGGRGTRVVETLEFGYGEFIDDVAWLPDGSGLLFSGFLYPEDALDVGYDYAGNIYRHDFVAGAVTKLSPFAEEYVRSLSVSPDGQHVVFELEAELVSDLPPDLWVMRLDGSDLRLLVEGARAPAWSR